MFGMLIEYFSSEMCS